MKTQEVSVWVSKARNYEVDAFCVSHHEQPNSIKAKLIIPVGPEVVEFEGVIHQDFCCAAYTGLKFMNSPHGSNSTMRNLQGRRWKCRFEEIV